MYVVDRVYVAVVKYPYKSNLKKKGFIQLILQKKKKIRIGIKQGRILEPGSDV